MRRLPPGRARRPGTPSPQLPTPLALLAAALFLHLASASGVFELQILEFSNPRLQLSSGACCGGADPAPAAPAPAPPAPACAAPCRTRFALCLKEYQSSAAPGACSFGRASSPVLGTDSFTLLEPLYTLALPFTFRWTRSFTLILQAYDDYNSTESEDAAVAGGGGGGGGGGGLIAEAWWSGIVEPGAAWHALRGDAGAHSVAYRVRVTCQPNYYNSTCTTFCRARDDAFGHYTCTEHGDKHCLPGWRGDNCDIPVCKEGCHPTHGRCDKPGDCDCRPGWRGELCAQCTPYPGCKHGYCNGSSWDCTCDTNWGGILCDQDLNYCGTHEPCQNGGTCENTAPDQYLCTCAEGFSGESCERVDNPCAPQPCRHGACALQPDPPGFHCSCQQGWGGALCDIDVDECSSSPCQHGGTCRDLVAGWECACAAGWRGAACEEDVDECAGGGEGALGPCVNAAQCLNAPGGFSCACLAGWEGATCARNVDDCAPRPCLHGATCIDLVDDFHCACAPGYAGRTCARDVDECASRPCRHGGECVDLLDAYRCICPVGFSGNDCELPLCSGRYCPDDRDHCAAAPCGNGATCYTAQQDYYCHCPPGWQGRNCTSPSPPAAPLPSPAAAAAAACPAPCGPRGLCASGRCVCHVGWTGTLCDIEIDECSPNPCHNNATCVDGVADFTCVCRDGWTGKTCGSRATELGWCVEGACLNGGSCGGDGACECRAGWAGARCERPADPCASSPCARGRCVPRGARYSCECAPGWGGAACAEPAACAACPRHAACVPDPDAGYRCVCPPPSNRDSKRCLEQVAGLGDAEDLVEEEYGASSSAGGGGAGGAVAEGGACSAENGTWWWGCNACWCARGAAACTRLWCGLPDCLAPGAAACRPDEVCVPAAPALCLRAPCAAPGECRRVAGRRVEPPPLPAPAACWAARAAAPPPGCARAELELARERLAHGAHVERACSALRRALAVALAPRTTPLVLLCDRPPDDRDALDLTLWVGGEEGVEGYAALAAALRALSELVSRRRLAQHALLGAALHLHVSAAREPAAAPRPAPHASPSLALPASLVALLCAALLAAAALYLRRRRAAARASAERSRHDEEKSNNLQNEENLRRYANPLRDEEAGAGGGGAVSAEDLPRALYKAQNADARNNTPPRLNDKEFTKRALPPPEPPPAAAARRHLPPERLTVLV